MPVAVCPHCRAELDLDAEDAGALVECPACRAQFTAATGPISAPSPPPEPPWRNAPGPPPRRASEYDNRRRGQFDDYNDRLDRQQSWPYRDHNDDPQELIRHAKEECDTAASGVMVAGMLTTLMALVRLVVWFTGLETDTSGERLLLIGYAVYSVLAGGFWIYAGSRMKQVKQHGLSLLACVTVIIPGVNPCCLLGLIFGLMGINKLNDPRVKRGFQANRPGFDPDTPA